MRVFIEIQKFDQWWLRAGILFVFAASVVPIAMSLPSNDTSDPVMWTVLLPVIIITGGLIFLVLFGLKLNTKIDDIGVHFNFFPFKRSPRTISWSEIEKIYTREYSPIGEYGGWGYRGGFLRKGSVAYNVKGNKGIQLELKSGKKILIGTQKQSEANTVITYYTNKSETYDSL